MAVFLPKTNIESDPVAALESIEETLTFEGMKQWTSLLEYEKVLVEIPKLTFRTDYDLNDKLQKMGIHLAFDSQKADFGGIVDIEKRQENFFIGQVIHKTFLDISEEGTEAAAVTAMAAEGCSPDMYPPPEKIYHFRGDHPFIFMIEDSETGALLFMGRIVDPKLQSSPD
jgi:serpin B